MAMPQSRRSFLAASAAAAAAGSALALPAVTRAQGRTTLKVIPQIDLGILDPHTTTAYVTRNHGYMVFDTLYGMDASYKPTPQMVEAASRLRTVGGQLSPALIPAGSNDRVLAQYVQRFQDAAAKWDAAADCPAQTAALSAIGDACEACHRDYR